MKKIFALMLAGLLVCATMVGCSKSPEEELEDAIEDAADQLEDLLG